MLIAIVGPVKSGKSKALLETYKSLSVEHKCVLLASCVSQENGNTIKSRCGLAEEAIPIKSYYEAVQYIDDNEYIFIDEVQFLPNEQGALKAVINRAIDKTVIVCGLDMDFRGDVFPTMATTLCMADEVRKMNGNCDICKVENISTMSLRLENGKPAEFDAELVSLDGEENGGVKIEYLTTCRDCYIKTYKQTNLDKLIEETQKARLY